MQYIVYGIPSLAESKQVKIISYKLKLQVKSSNYKLKVQVKS